VNTGSEAPFLGTPFGTTNTKASIFGITLSREKREHRFENSDFEITVSGRNEISDSGTPISRSPFYKNSGAFLREVERIIVYIHNPDLRSLKSE